MAAFPEFLIKSTLPIAGMHWGLEFNAGVAYTTDVALAGKLLRKGYAVTCVSAPKEEPAPEPPTAVVEPEKAPEQPAKTPVPAAKVAAPKGTKKVKKG
jgi:hypothetical protein